MAVEQVGLALSMDLSAANREIAKTRENALTLGGGLEKIDRASMAAAKGIGAMGPALGTLSRSSSDVLRGLGDVAGLIGSGGALGIGLGLAAVGVSKLVDAWTASERAAKSAAEEAVRSAKTITESINESIEGIELAKTKAETGLTDTAEARARMLRVELSGLNYEIGELQKTAPQGVVSKFFSDSDNKLDAAVAKAKALRGELANIDAALARRASAQLGAPPTAPAGRTPASRSRSAGPALTDESTGGDYGFVLEEDAAILKRQEAANLAAIDLDEKKEKARRDLARETAQILDNIRMAELDKQKAANDAQIAAETDKYARLTGGVALLTGELAASLVAGQESAWAQFLAGAASQAGQYVILEGSKVLATGIGGALVGNPAAPAQIAGGLALMAAGAAVQTGGAAAAQQLAGAGGGGGATPGGGAAARREPGVNRGSRGGSGGRTNNEATVINVTYSAAGPRPEDTGREVDRALRTHYRRTGGRLG